MRPLILLPKRIAISAFPKPHLNLLHISRKVAQLTNQNSPTPCKKSATTTPPVTKLAFWTDKPTWSRAGVNTLRCLVGCTLGDFSALWMLQSLFPEMGMGAVMGVSSKYIPCKYLFIQHIYLHLPLFQYTHMHTGTELLESKPIQPPPRQE
jgi:hypothetical protein